MKKILAVVLGLGLIFSSVLDSFAGSRSYSSGSSSRSSFGRSYSSGGSKSYSAAPKPSVSTPRPSASPAPSGGKSYSSGGKGYSYSSGVPPSIAPKPPNYTPGTSYGSGNRTYSPVPSTSPSKGGVVYDGGAAAAQKRAESRTSYVRGPESKKTYTTPTGNSVPINTNSGSYRNVTNITHETYITRDTRIHTFYSSGYIGMPYYSRPIVVYNDSYNSLFWYWLLDRSIEQQAMWAYCHRADMDTARYNALLARDANLAARVRTLDAQKAAVDPTYVPTGLSSPDLMYTDDYVDSVINPHVVQTHPVSPGVVARVLFWIFMTFLGIIVLIVFYNLVFVKKW